MRGIKIAFLAIFLSAASSEHEIRNYESECNRKLGSPLSSCQRACELERMGLLTDGIFDIQEAIALVGKPDGLKLYPEHHGIILKAALSSCNREIAPADSLDRCTAATAMYYCLKTLLQPEIIYRKNARELHEKKPEPLNSLQI